MDRIRFLNRSVGVLAATAVLSILSFTCPVWADVKSTEPAAELTTDETVLSPTDPCVQGMVPHLNLENLPEEDVEVPNPVKTKHSVLPQFDFIYGNETSYGQETTNPAELKIGALLDGYRLSPSRRDWVLQAFRIAQRISIPNFKRLSGESTTLRLTDRIRLVEALCDAGYISEARTTYDRTLGFFQAAALDMEKQIRATNDQVETMFVSWDREMIRFWVNHLQIYTKARIARALSDQGFHVLSDRLVAQVLTEVRLQMGQQGDAGSIISNNSFFKVPFDPKTVIVAASQIASIRYQGSRLRRTPDLSLFHMFLDQLKNDKVPDHEIWLTIVATGLSIMETDVSSRDKVELIQLFIQANRRDYERSFLRRLRAQALNEAVPKMMKHPKYSEISGQVDPLFRALKVEIDAVLK